MPQDDQLAKKNKTHLIGFRIDEDAYSELENRAVLAGKTVNDWCRDELLARIAEGVPLTASEELIHGEIIRFGNVLVNFLTLLGKRQMTAENAEKLVNYLHLDRKELAKMYFGRLAKEGREEGE